MAWDLADPERTRLSLMGDPRGPDRVNPHHARLGTWRLGTQPQGGPRSRSAPVRDSPTGRLSLVERSYRGPFGRTPRNLPFRRRCHVVHELAAPTWLARTGRQPTTRQPVVAIHQRRSVPRQLRSRGAERRPAQGHHRHVPLISGLHSQVSRPLKPGIGRTTPAWSLPTSRTDTWPRPNPCRSDFS